MGRLRDAGRNARRGLRVTDHRDLLMFIGIPD